MMTLRSWLRAVRFQQQTGSLRPGFTFGAASDFEGRRSPDSGVAFAIDEADEHSSGLEVVVSRQLVKDAETGELRFEDG